MERKITQSVRFMNQQAGKSSQVLTIDGCRVKINYLSSRTEEGNENVLGHIQKSLLAACQTK